MVESGALSSADRAAESDRGQDDKPTSKYRSFWNDVGNNFPDLAAARSTEGYRADEQRLFRDYLSPLEGLRVMKTDLWDEAKNTRILKWAGEEGAKCYGVDISLPIVRLAKAEFGNLTLRAPRGDVRWLPYRAASFDAIYSMGTIEHFDETDQAIDEIFRILKPGGRAVIGVPNRWDPFLRPLMVAIMYRLGLYGYGFEKCYSRKALRRMLEEAGFEVVADSGILFIPGWLRILDLACSSWCRPLAPITGFLSRQFAKFANRFPRLHRHGYLIVAVGVRPPA